MNSVADASTPELDKQRAALAPRPVNDVLSEFVDWLTAEGIVLARYGRRGERREKCGHCSGRGFDPDKLTARQRQLLEIGRLPDADREPCPVCPDRSGYVWREYVDEDSLEPLHEAWDRLFARHLGLDLNAIEQERRALLAALRGEA